MPPVRSIRSKHGCSANLFKIHPVVPLYLKFRWFHTRNFFVRIFGIFSFFSKNLMFRSAFTCFSRIEWYSVVKNGCTHFFAFSNILRHVPNEFEHFWKKKCFLSKKNFYSNIFFWEFGVFLTDFSLSTFYCNWDKLYASSICQIISYTHVSFWWVTHGWLWFLRKNSLHFDFFRTQFSALCSV